MFIFLMFKGNEAKEDAVCQSNMPEGLPEGSHFGGQERLKA